MRITIFGATGGTGTQLVEQALAGGYQVTAVVRDPARLAIPEHRCLQVVRATSWTRLRYCPPLPVRTPC